MKRKMISTICMILIATFCLGLTSCFKKTREPSNFDLHVDDYSIVTRDGTHYIIFDDITKYKLPPELLVSISAYLTFNTVEDARQAVMNGTLNDGEKAHMVLAFPKDDIGIPICDFNNMYVPKLPRKWTVSCFNWSGTHYSFPITAKDGSYGYISCISKGSYENSLKELDEMFDNENISIEELTVTADNKTIGIYTTDNTKEKEVIYKLSDRGRTVTVSKSYRFESKTSPSTSSPTLMRIEMYIEEDGVYSLVSLNNLVKDPTDRWLLKFGLE